MAENEPTTTEEEVRTEEIPYETERNDNPDLESGTESVTQEGQVGELTITESVTYDENGEEINREVISEEVTTEPINEIIDVGTQVTRVVEETKKEPVSFKTERQENSSLEQGTENVLQEGREGERTIVEEVTYVNDVETDRVVKSDDITIEPVDEVIEFGTQTTETIEETKTEVVDYEVERVANPTLNVGVENITQEGVNGERTIIEEVTLVNGEEADRIVVSDEITTEAVNKIIEYGTKVPNNNQNRRNKKMIKEVNIVWRDKVLSSYNGNIESVLIQDAEGANIEVPNGVFVTLGGLAGMGREVKVATLGADEGEALLVASPEVLYESGKELEDFVNEAGKVARAFRLSDGDVITLTEDLIKGAEPTVGAEFAVGTDGYLAPVGDASPALIFKVREDAGHELHREAKAWRFDIVK